MPYDVSKPSGLPENVEKLPEQKQRQWIEIFNSAFKKAKADGKSDEEAETFAFQNANGVVLKKEVQEASYRCECLKCGHIVESKQHCRDFQCPKCGGEMRQEKRPGPGFTGSQLYVKLVEGDSHEVKILYPGEFTHDEYGKFKITDHDLEQAVENWENNIATRLDESGEKELPVDYQHSAHDPDPDIAKASGWIKGLFLKGKELWARVDWTEKAKEYIAQKEYKYLSAEFDTNWKDENGKAHGFTVLGLALTNVNFLKKNLPALAFMEINNDIITFQEAKKGNENLLTEDDKQTKEIKMEEKLRELLGLKEGEDIVEAITKLMAEKSEKVNEKSQKENEELTETIKGVRELLEIDEKTDLTETVKALKEQADKANEDGIVQLKEDEYHQLKAGVKDGVDAMKQLKVMLKDQLIEQGFKEKKLSAADVKEWAGEMALNNPDTFKKILSTRKPMIEFKEYGTDSDEQVEDTLQNLAQVRADKDKISFTDALRQVAKERPDLVGSGK